MVWLFERDSQELSFEIRRTPKAYEMAVLGPSGTVDVQQAESAADLLAQIGTLPQALLQDGWRPRHYSSLNR